MNNSVTLHDYASEYRLQTSILTTYQSLVLLLDSSSLRCRFYCPGSTGMIEVIVLTELSPSVRVVTILAHVRVAVVS